jgi:adenosylcobinamide-phosphate synthase
MPLTIELPLVLSVAFLLDLLIGDPPYRYHPIRILGRYISLVEKALRKMGGDETIAGVLLVLIVETTILACYVAAVNLLSSLHPVFRAAFNLYLCYSCLALGDLLNHAKPIVRALEAGNLDTARRRVAMVVSRETRYLDEQGLIRATVETLAENFVDGFFSPLFWFSAGALLAPLLGTPPLDTAIAAMLFFKAVSTLDSMVGYRNRSYLQFGRASARLDDVMNFLSARLSISALFLGACMTRLAPLEGLSTALRDRLKHDSPNAGHAESFVAGSLHIRLGGPTRYPDGLKDKPWLGNGTTNMTTLHVRQAAALVRCSGWIALGLVVSLFLIFYARAA